MRKEGFFMFLALSAVVTLMGWGACAAFAAEESGASTADTQAATADQKAAPSENAEDEVAVIETDYGVIVLEFFPDIAPNHVARFKELAREGWYDNTASHRIVKGFMAQFGNPATKQGEKPRPVPPLKAEFNERPHVRGSLSAARTNDPNSASSQFFLVLDRAPHLDRQYTNYGQVVAGEEVLLKIGDVPVKMNAFGEKSEPTERVSINKVLIVPRSEGLKIAAEKNAK
jgi:peptidyl-prolyl cis-trans isomerase B (cyclophilin B)